MFLAAEVAGGDKLRLSVTARVFLKCLHFSSLCSFSSQSPPLLLHRCCGGRSEKSPQFNGIKTSTGLASLDFWDICLKTCFGVLA